MTDHRCLQVFALELLCMQSVQTLATGFELGKRGLGLRTAAIRPEAAEVGECGAVRLVHLAGELQHLANRALGDGQLRQGALLLVEHRQRTERLRATACSVLRIALGVILQGTAQRVAVRRRAAVLLRIALLRISRQPWRRCQAL